MNWRRFFLLISFLIIFFLPCFAENEVAISVNGGNIYMDEFDYIFKNATIGINDEDALERKKKELISSLIDGQLYIQEAKRRGVTAKMFAGEEEIDELLLANPVPTSEEKAARDRAERIILKYKESQILPIKVISALKEDVSEDDINVMEEYFKRADKIRIKYIKIDPYAIADGMEISEDEIKDYYRGHSDLFKKPAVKRYRILYLDPADYVTQVDLTPSREIEYYNSHLSDFQVDKQVDAKYVIFRPKDYTGQLIDLGVNTRQYYQENLDKFFKPAEAKVRMISLKKPLNKKKLHDLQNEIKQWVSFSDLAKKYSDDPMTAPNGGDMGIIRKGQLKEPFNSIVFAMQTGGISEPIESDNEYDVFYVEQKKEGCIQPFDEVKGKIEEQLLSDAADPLALADAKRFKVEAKKYGFERSAANKKLTIYETGLFGVNGRIPAFPDDQLFKRTALGLGSGEVSDEISCNGAYVVIEAFDIRNGAPRSFDLISPEVAEKIIHEDSYAYAASDAAFALKLFSEKTSFDELKKKVKFHDSISDSPTFESAAKDQSVIKGSGGYCIVLPYEEEPAYVLPFKQVAEQAASVAVLDKADKIAEAKAAQILASGEVTGEAAIEAVFSKGDYVLNKEYVRPLIEQCSGMQEGQTGIIKSSGKYYVVQVLQQAMEIPGYKDDSAVIKSEVLKEKRAEYVQEWLKKEREKAQVQINI